MVIAASSKAAELVVFIIDCEIVKDSTALPLIRVSDPVNDTDVIRAKGGLVTELMSVAVAIRVTSWYFPFLTVLVVLVLVLDILVASVRIQVDVEARLVVLPSYH